MNPSSPRRRFPLAVWLIRLAGQCLAVWVTGAVIVELAALGPRAHSEAGLFPDRWRSFASGGLPDALLRAGGASLGVAGLGLGIVLAFGPVIGVLAGRFRRRGQPWLWVTPLLVAGWLPVWWLLLWSIAWRVEHWRHPGFADAPAAQAGPVWVEPLWQASQIAVLAALAPTAWYLSQLAAAFRMRTAEPHAQAARMRGLGAGGLFYRHVLRLSLGPFIRGIDAALPLLLGGQILLEWTFRYPGLGRLLVESARNGDFTGLLAALLLFGTGVVLVRSLLEALHRAVDPLAVKPAGPPLRF